LFTIFHFTFNKNYIFLILLVFFYNGCKKKEEINNRRGVETFLITVTQIPVTDEDYYQLTDSLFNFSRRMDFKRGVAASFFLKGKYFSSKGKNDEAAEKFKEAIKIGSQTGDLVQLGDSHYFLGSAYFDAKNRNEAITSLKESAVIRSKSNDSTGLGSSYNFIGYIYWIISDYDSAVYYFERALSIRNKLPNIAHRATTYNNLGTVYYNWSLYDKALDHYLRSLEYQKKEKNNSGIARCLSNIGLVYKETAQNEKAIEYYKESLPYAISSNQVQTIGYAYNCLGTAFSVVNKDSALFYLKKSLDVYQSGNDTVGLALANQGIGNFYLDNNDPKNAKIYFVEMLKMAQRENVPMRVARAYKGLGQAYLLENDLATAKEYFEKSILIGEKSSIKFILRDAFGSLSEIYERLGNSEKAFAALKQYNKYKQDIEDEGMQKRLLDLKNKSDYEKYQRNLQTQKYENEKQKIYLVVTITAVVLLMVVAVMLFRLNNRRRIVNLLLQEKNRLIEGQSKEINLKNVELLELNEAKEKLFSIIAHDLRSPFNSLINLGTVLKEDYDILSDEEKLDYITHLEETAIKTHELVENLLNLSASHTGRIDFNPERIDVHAIVEKIIKISRTQAAKKEITLRNMLTKDVIVVADQSMLEIIIRNLMNNAIKYCNNGGKVEISSFKEGTNLNIIIEDNGIGMDDATKVNIFNINVIRSTKGTNGEKGTGLGLGLCKEFVEKHGGNIWVDSQVGEGSKFVFSLPMETINTTT
jgi:signal transduction histidine kinase